jgi:DNA-binding NtrC family response regulator
MASMDRLQRLEALRHLPVLRHLPLPELDRVADRTELRRFAAGSALIEEGAEGDALFALLEGGVRVCSRLGEGGPCAVALRGAGELVGEMALLDDLPRSASVVAVEDVCALRIPRAAFLGSLGASAEAALDLVRMLSRRLRESDAAQLEALRGEAEQLASRNRRLSRENRRLLGELERRFGFEAFAGSSAAADAARAAARRAAESDLPVLLVGEPGTGKKLLARAIHGASERRGRPFVEVRCALFSELLLESELFGHARGAFAAAHAPKPGLIERAHGGTLFLDALTDVPRPVQAGLLRFLELGELRRLGETAPRRADVRIVAALPMDVEKAVALELLRPDLQFRLDVFRIVLPPLRERLEDLPELVQRLAGEAARRLGRAPLAFEPDAIEALRRNDFPGNVGELCDEIEGLCAVLPGGARVTADSLPPRLRRDDPWSAGGYAESVRVFKRRLLREALLRSGGSRPAAARRLGLHPSNLLRMVRELDVEAKGPEARHPERRRRGRLARRSHDKYLEPRG